MHKQGNEPPPYGFHEPPGAHPHQPPQPAVVVMHTVTTALGTDSQPMKCPSCQHHVSTRVETKATSKTHLMALLLCLFLCWPCACVPYCMDSCQSADHYCPNCKAFLGTCNR